MKNVKHFIACSFILIACSAQVYGSDRYSEKDGELITFDEEDLNNQEEQVNHANKLLIQAALNKDYKGVTQALGLGAYVDHQDESGNTAFHYLEDDDTFFGTDKHHRKAKAMLILHQANLKIENKEHQTVDEIQNAKIYSHPLYIWMAIQEHKAKELENNAAKSHDSSK